MRKISYNFIKNFVEDQNYKLLTREDEYINTKNKILLLCPNGHEYRVLGSNFKSKNSRCSECFQTLGNIEKIKNVLKQEGYETLDTEYYHKKRLNIKCPYGHEYKALGGNFFYRKRRCPYCAGKKNQNYIQGTYDMIKHETEKLGFQLLSNTYKNIKTKLKFKCNNGHVFESTGNHFFHGKTKCIQCYGNEQSSTQEKEIQEFVSNIYDGQIINNDRDTIINPLTGYNLELDVYLPELNKAIECNGIYGHSLKDNLNRDRIKIGQCQKNEIELLVIQDQLGDNYKKECMVKIGNFINGLWKGLND